MILDLCGGSGEDDGGLAVPLAAELDDGDDEGEGEPAEEHDEYAADVDDAEGGRHLVQGLVALRRAVVPRGLEFRDLGPTCVVVQRCALLPPFIVVHLNVSFFLCSKKAGIEYIWND